jgi:cell division protein FtsZ
VANEKTTFAAAFAMADQVLYSGVASITELMTKEGLINLDFADVRAIMSEMGKAMMGTGEASGEKRAIEAAEAAISNPLLDDVSMRGARGLLISITGGPDLTLYEVDEAATRIREEVDPEANIILGATFDDSLEGTMRVSVVATGLATEAGASDVTDADDADGEAVSSAHAGYDMAPVPAAIAKKPIQPAPMAARIKVTTQPPAAHIPNEDLTADGHQAPVSPSRPAARGGARMPTIDEFPPIAQKQIAAQQNRIENIAEHAARKKQGIFHRLANVGRGRRDDEAPPAREPAMPAQRSEPKIQARAQAKMPQPPAPAQVHIDPGLDDDQLEIPAFLRRQAN